MNVEEIIKMYKEGYSIDYIVKCYYNFKNSKRQQNYFNSSGDLIITKKFKKQEAYDYVYGVLYAYTMEERGK